MGGVRGSCAFFTEKHLFSGNKPNKNADNLAKNQYLTKNNRYFFTHAICGLATGKTSRIAKIIAPSS